MVRYLSLIIFIGLSFAQDITIAVLDFDGDGVSQSETRTLTNRLRDEIFNTGIYIVLERGKMDEVLKEQGFQQTGCTTSECAVEVGRMLGVQQMVAGSIGKVGTVYTVSARIFDVQTGKILKSANYDHIGDLGQLLIKGMKDVVNQLITGLNQEPKEIMGLSSTMLQDSIETEILANSEVMKHGQNYLVSIDNIFLDESDFGKYTSFFRFTYDLVEIIVVKNFNHKQSKILTWGWDNKLIDTSVSKRGIIGVNKHQVLKFNKDYVYEIAIIEPKSSPKNIYWIKSEKGDWMFRKGKVQFGKNSYIELSQVLK